MGSNSFRNNFSFRKGRPETLSNMKVEPPLLKIAPLNKFYFLKTRFCDFSYGPFLVCFLDLSFFLVN